MSFKPNNNFFQYYQHKAFFKYLQKHTSMPTMSCKQKGLLKRVTKNVMNMRKLFNSSKKKEDSWYDPDKVTNETKDNKDVISSFISGLSIARATGGALHAGYGL